MTLLVISPDYASHAGPLITLAGAWRDAGERVVVATGRAVAPLVAAAGMEAAGLVLGRGSNPGVARAEDQPPGEDEQLRAFFEATRRGMIPTLRFQAQARERDLLWNPIEVARRTLGVVEAVRPDAILVDHLAFSATMALRAAGIPYADVVPGHPRQLPVVGETYGVPGDWPAAFRPDPAAMDDLRAVASGVAGRFTAAYNTAMRHINPDADAVDDAFAAHGPLVLFNYPRGLHPAGRTPALPAAHDFLGGAPRHEEPPDAVRAWLEDDPSRPVVMVSFGTFLSARGDVLRTVVDGLRNLDIRVALATGSADRGRLGELPAHWLVDAYLPQVSILGRASALVTHAGNNSVSEALAAGVPMLALPFSTDQFDGAAAIERAGVGLAMDPNAVGSHDVADAVRRLLETPHPALDQLAAELTDRPGPGVARAAVLGAFSSVATSG